MVRTGVLTGGLYVPYHLYMTTTTSEFKSFPPADDAIEAVKNIDWDLMNQRSRRDIRYIGKALCAVGEALHNLGTKLSDV